MKTKINILGTEYTIKELSEEECTDIEKNWGICNDKTKEIVIDKKLSEKEMLVFKKKVLRHEITHAFLGESGLRECSLICDGGWANNEEMVDWFAIQSPKIFKVFQELTLLGDVISGDQS